MIFAVVGLIATAPALALVVPAAGGAMAAVPVIIGLDTVQSPHAGMTIEGNIGYVTMKSIPLRIEYIKPARVTKIHYGLKPTKFVDGSPVWVLKNVPAHKPRVIDIWQTFPTTLKRNQKVHERFIVSSPGYAPYHYQQVEYAYN